jgi:hypothetical protein
MEYKGKDEQLVSPDPNVVFPYEEACLTQGMIAP